MSDEPKIIKVVSVRQKALTVDCDDGNRYKRTGGTLAWKNHNPGNIKYGEFARNFGALAKGYGGHAIFASYDDGAMAQEQLLFSREGNYYDLSIADAIAKYAPADDPNPIAHNEPDRYAKYVADAAGVSTDTKLIELSEERRQLLLTAMRKMEGFKKGTITLIGPTEVA